VYNKPGWRRLVEAESEAQSLQTLYGAKAVDASTGPLLECIAGNPAADLLHFAMHGSYDPNGLQDGLVLVDGRILDPAVVRGVRLSRTPVVFLNACQVGSGDRVLGDYAGMAEAFLFAGASAVVAPLWSINDTVARELALRFYENVFKGASPAGALRAERANLKDAASTTSATSLAYQFFGHPAMRITRPTDGG
jgi:CHAT domain-containing protein